MELILFDEKMEEIGPVLLNTDFEVGDSSALNNFEIPASTPIKAHGIYVPGTEWGGIFEYEEGATNTDETITKGWTWRGLLTQAIIEPPTGSDYKVVSGEANTVIGEILSDVLGGLFTVPKTDSGLVLKSHTFNRYTTVLEGLTDMLTQHGYRLKITARKVEAGGSIKIFCEAVKAKTIEGQYDEDSGLVLRFVRNGMGVNHLICMGQGELAQRQRIDLYMQPDGTVGKTKYYTGFLERTAYYDGKQSESLEELESDGVKRLLSIANTKRLEITTVQGEELDIGDVVVGRYRELNITVEKPITRKILRTEGECYSVEYQVKGEE